MLDIGGRQQLRPTYPAERSYPQQDEPLSTNLECPQGSNRKDATPAVPASFSDSLSQPQCLAQPKNKKQTSLFSSEEQQLLEQQLGSLPEGVPVCQCLTMTTNSRSSKISDSSTITTATITTSTTTAAALSTLVQNQNVLHLAPNTMPPGQQSDTSFSFVSLAKYSTLKSSTSPSPTSFPPSSHQTQSQILQQQKTCFSMSPKTFPLQQQQQQQYHFPANAALSSSRQCNTDSVDGGVANSQENPNGRSCSSEVADSASGLGVASRYTMAFITNKLKIQEPIDDAIDPENLPGYVHAAKDSQLCNVSVSSTISRLYPSSPQKKPAVITGGGPDTWPSKSGQGSDLQATVQGLLGLRLGDRPDQSAAVPPHHLITSSSNDTNRSAYSGLIPPTSVALSSTSSLCCSVQTENPTSDKVNDCGVISNIEMSTCSDADSFTDISPGTPPDPPKKKHCRSLSIPSGSSGSSRTRRSTGGISTTDSSRCCTSLWKPIAFTDVNEASNPPKVQQQQSLPFQHYSGQGTPPDVQKTSPFSLSTSPLSPNTGMSASLTSLLQPTSSGCLFSSARISGPVSTNQNGALSLAALVTTLASTSVSPSQFHMAPSQMPVNMLTSSSPPPLASGKPSSHIQTHFSNCLQSPPDSPVPRPASVSVVGCRCEDDSDSRAFKPVLDPWLCRSQSRGNSGFSSPSSCSSSSSSFLLVPPQSDPHNNNTEIQSATISGLLAAPVPLTQTPHCSPTCTPSSLSSPATVTGRTNSQTPLQPPYWPFQKHRSFSLEEQLSQMGKPTSTSPSSFFSPSPPSSSSSSSVLSSPSHYHHHHHHPYHLPAPVFQTQQYQPSYHNHYHHHQHHFHHHHYQQQQLQQQQPPPPPPPQTVSTGGSTPNVPVACKSSVSNPSSPRRQRIPRCRSQPCVLHDRREGRKRRRDYDRPTLDFHKMTQTAYCVFQPDSSGKSFKQEQWTGLRQQTGDHAGLWFAPLVTTSTMNTPRISALPPPGLISLEVLRKTDLLASEHGDDPLSEDAEISAATEAGEAAARAAAAAAATTTKITTVATTTTTTTTTAALDSTVPAAMTTTAVAMDDEDEDENWECTDLRRPALFGRAINPIGRDMSVYVSDESNPSFCGCDDDEEEEEDDTNDDDIMDSDETMERGRNFQRTNQCMFPITDLDLNQIENH